MKIERWQERFCEVANKYTKVKIRVHLAERLCGYDIVRVSKCLHQGECGASPCEYINSEEEKGIERLITDYLEQQDVRDKGRESEWDF